MKNIKEKVLKEYRKVFDKHKFAMLFHGGLDRVIEEAINLTLAEVKSKVCDKCKKKLENGM